MEVTGPDDGGVPPQGSAVTIGAYDGVHLGHRHLLSELQRHARAGGLLSVVVTFDRHPAMVVRPGSAPPLLTDLAQKLELLEEAGIERTVVVPFDRRRADEPAEEFVAGVLVRSLAVKVVVVGEDFHFGHDRRGNVALLEKLGRDAGFEVVGVPLETNGSAAVSSTRIRSLVAGGEVHEAARLLGRPYEVRGVVRHGDGRGGSELGMPTANVHAPSEILLPGDGVYAGWYRDATGTRRPAAVSVGRRPTFYDAQEQPLVEAHLLDFSGDLYDQPASVLFVRRLHGQRRYRSTEELVVHMRADVTEARAVLETTR